MAQIPDRDVQQLFQENSEKTWPGFRRVLQEHKEGHLGGIDQGEIDQLLVFTHHMEEDLQTYPISAEQLERQIKSQLPESRPEWRF